MPEPNAGTRPVIALVMIISAVSLGVLAIVIYLGAVPLPEETRGIAALVVGAAAFADFLVSLWFFRKAQSS